MSDFVDAVVSATGEHVVIPAHWVGNPILFRGYKTYVAPVAEPVAVAPESEPVEPDLTPDPPAPAEPPAKSAPKDDWVAFAVYSGMPADEAEASTKDDLVKKFA